MPTFQGQMKDIPKRCLIFYYSEKSIVFILNNMFYQHIIESYNYPVSINWKKQKVHNEIAPLLHNNTLN